MTGYQPRDGEFVYATFRVEYRDIEGGSPVFELPGAGIDWWPASTATEVRRALPVDGHTLILAHVEEEGVRLLELRDMAPPFGDPGEEAKPDLQWVVTGTTGRVIAPHAIDSDWVEIDRETLRAAAT